MLSLSATRALQQICHRKLTIQKWSYYRSISIFGRELSTTCRDLRLTQSYESSVSHNPLSGATIGQLFDEQVEKTPDKEAVVYCHDGIRLSFAELQEKVDSLAVGLLSLGLKPGDRVGLWCPNQVEWSITQFATAQVGMILVNVNPAYRPNELEYALKKVGVKSLIMAETFKTQDYYQVLSELCPELDQCQPNQLVTRRLPDLKSIIICGEQAHPGVYTFGDVSKMGGASERDQYDKIKKRVQFDEPINIQFTSGTTGSPKPATLTHHNLVNNARLVAFRMGYDKKECRIAVQVPLYHCFGMILGSLTGITHGTTCVYPSPSFNAEATLNAVQNERCNMLYGTPTMYIDILNHPDFDKYDVTSLESGVMAGSPCPITLMRECTTRLHMPRICIAYGSTESTSVVYLSHPGDPIEKRCSTVGALQQHTEAKIINERGDIVPIGEQGELCTRGYSNMYGYWDDAEKSNEVISKTQWYHTGDLATMGPDGYVMVNGRKKDMIIRGGENIYPVEIEQFLHRHPDIEDAQVIGVPDERMGEEVCAVIRVKEGCEVTERNIKDFCKGEISHFKIPRYIWFVDEYPLTVTGKVQKFKMREQAVETWIRT